MGDWIAKGVVSPSRDYDGWWGQSRFMVAQSLVALGLAITIVGFIQVFRAYKEKHLQTQGLYATVRHPQHLGIAFWTFGLAFAVNGTAAYMTWFTVLYLYVVLALWEESNLRQQFGSAYDSYGKATPFMIPFVNVGLPLPKSGGQRLAALAGYYVAGMAVLCLVMQAIVVQHPSFL
jgi:protein-S-isoprenylcysteine O-methyltransferase Ste14